jgi:uncharacterized membrane protein YccC
VLYRSMAYYVCNLPVNGAHARLTMSTVSARNYLRQLGHFEWHRIAPWRAARAALGVCVPLIGGYLTGYVEYGAYIALGALPAGFTSFQGEARTRIAAVVLASVGMAASTFVGATTAATAPWLLVPIIALWGYVTGLSVCLGPARSSAVLQWPVALLIAIGLPLPPREAALRAGLVFAGGALQALLVALSWTVRTGAKERMRLAASYRALAKYASTLAAGICGPPPPTELPARSILADPNPLLGQTLRLMLINLLEQAERIRASLAALAADAEHEPAETAEIHALIAEVAHILDLVATAIAGTRDERDAATAELSDRVMNMTVPADKVWRWSGEALLGQLRAVARMLHDTDESTHAAASPIGSHAPTTRDQVGFASSLAMLWANVTIATEAGRHALRLAVVAAAAEALVQALQLYQGRWVTLTIFIVLKPDYRSTFSRGVQRALGTMLGAALGATAAQWSHPDLIGLVLAASISAAAAYAAFEVSYLLFSVLLTFYIMSLLVLLGMPAVAMAEARILDTLIGATLALIAYAGWPTWEGTTAREKFARLIESHRDYATALLAELAQPGSVQPGQLRSRQAAARRARSDAEAATARLADEPGRTKLTSEFANVAIATVSRLALAELALHALVLAHHGTAGTRTPFAAQLDELSAALALAMNRTAAGLRAFREPEPLPPLRPIYTALKDALPGDAPLTVLVDRLIDASNTLDAAVREALRASA